jgi:hypothetical protein
MQTPKSMHLFTLLTACVLVLLAGCNGSPTGNRPPDVIQAYLQALVSKDVNQMINLSCANWEAQARQEYDSFAAVKLSLKDLQCQQASQESAGSAVVSCTGAIIASYGAEDMQLELNDRPFIVTKEGNEWRMCGYK